MTKKNIRPQQVAPVQRETTATSFQSGNNVTLSFKLQFPPDLFDPFAGDDAE